MSRSFYDKLEKEIARRGGMTMDFLGTILAGAVIGVLASFVTGKRRGCIFNIIAGIVGSVIGERLFSLGGPTIGGLPILSSVLGAIIFVAVISLFFGRKND